MKKFNTSYYLLFMLLIMGALAAMAQNNYGLTILGMVAFAFSFLFATQLLTLIIKKERLDIWSLLEPLSLFLLALLLGLRVFYVRFAFAELIFAMAGILFLLVNAKKLMDTYRSLSEKNIVFSWILISFWLSLSFYTLSMAVVPVVASLAEPLGMVAFGLFIIFVFAGLLKREFMIDGEKISAFKYVAQLKDHSLVLLSLFLVFTFYAGLTKVGVLPKMYSNEYPQAYFELVNRAESGTEKPTNGKYKHQEFKEVYDRFVERNLDINKK